MSLAPSPPTPPLKVRLLATAAFALLLAVAVFGAYKGIAPTATLEAASPGSVIGGAASVQAGAAVTYYLDLVKGAPGEVVPLRVVDAGGLSIDGVGNVTRDSNGSATVPLLVGVPSGAAPGVKLFTLSVGARLQTFQVTVLAPKAAPAPGTAMGLDFTFRTADGKLWDSTLSDVARSPLPKRADFVKRQVYRAYGWKQGDTTEVIPLLGPTLDGMQEGESRTIVLTPENTPGWLPSEPMARNVVLQRNTTVPRLTADLTVTYAALANATHRTLDETRNISLGAEVPVPISLDRTVVPFSVPSMALAYQVAAKGVGNVTLRILTNKTYTQYAFLPNATAVHVAGGAVVLRTTPAAGPGTVPFPAPWPNVSRVTAVTAANFTVQSTPQVGTTWTASNGESTLRVKEVTATQILVEEQNAFSPETLGTPRLYMDLVRRPAPTA